MSEHQLHRVIIERSKCCGYGLCAALCPEVYNLDAGGIVYVDNELVPDELLEACSVAGEPTEIAPILQKRYEGGLMQRASLYFSMEKDAPEGKWREFVQAFKSAA